MKSLKVIFYTFVGLASAFFIYRGIVFTDKQSPVGTQETINTIENNHYLEVTNNFLQMENLNLYRENGDTVKLSNVLKDEYALCFRYFDINCHSCIVSTLKKLRYRLPQIHFKIIASYQDPADLVLFKKMNQVEEDVFNIREGQLIEQIDSLKTPYLLILDKQLKVHSIHIINEGSKMIEKGYFKSLGNFFESKF